MSTPVKGVEAEVELTPTIKPRTKAEALEMALKWGNEWSHWNLHIEVGEDRGQALAACAQHDAAEVQRLAALHSMLPEHHTKEAPDV